MVLKRKIGAFILICTVILSVCACGKKVNEDTNENKINVEADKEDVINTEKEKENSSVEKKYDLSSLQEIIDSIDSNTVTSIDNIKKQYSELKTKLVDYKSYNDSYNDVTEFFNMIEAEETKLFETYEEAYQLFFKKAFEICEDRDSLKQAFDLFRDEIHEAEFQKIYDEIYDGVFVEYYNDYYDGIIEAERDKVEYIEWLDCHTKCYSDYLDAHSNFYDEYLDAHSKCYTYYLYMRDALYDDDINYEIAMENVRRIINEEENSDDSDEVDATTLENEANEDEQINTGIRPEFKKAMEEYVAFFEEYCDFIRLVDESDNTAEFMEKYNSYIKQYGEAMDAMNAINKDELSDEERELYLETLTKISNMLIEDM